MIVLQDCMDSLKDAPGSYSEACHDGNEVINIKGEVKGVQEEEVPDLSTFPVTKTQREVSCMFVCVYIYILLGLFLKYLLTLWRYSSCRTLATSRILCEVS
jgi:hypothetical protein